MANSVKKVAYWKLLLPFLTILLLIGLALVYAYGDIGASSSLKLVSVVALIISAGMTYGVNKLSRPLITPTLISVSFTFQLTVLTLYLMVGGSSIIRTSSYRPDLAANPYLAVLPLLILPAVTLIIVFFARHFLWKRNERSALFINLGDSIETQKLVYYLSISAGLMLFAMPAVVYFGLLGYFIRVLWAALSMTPLIAGWLSSKSRRVNYIWLAALSAALVLSLFTGSRGTAFRSIGYFMFGRIIGSDKKVRSKEFLRVSVLGIITVILFGFIGTLRDQIGRVGVDELSSERVSSVFESSEQSLNADSTIASGGETNLQHGLSRLIVNANQAVPLLTEKGIPTRGIGGIGGLGDEILSYVDLSLLSGSSKRTRLEQGLG